MTAMTSLNIVRQNGDERGWNRSISPRVARAGIALIAAAVALLGLVSVNVGTNSDASGQGPSPDVVQITRTS